MQGLAPLVVGFFVAMATILRFGKSAGLNELVPLNGRIARKRKIVFAETKIVCLPDLIGVVLAFEAWVRLRGLSVESELRSRDQQ